MLAARIGHRTVLLLRFRSAIAQRASIRFRSGLDVSLCCTGAITAYQTSAVSANKHVLRDIRNRWKYVREMLLLRKPVLLPTFFEGEFGLFKTQTMRFSILIRERQATFQRTE